MDRGMWITWYDLAPEVRDEHLAWTHERYIPRVLARSGVLWAAHYASIRKGDVRVHTDDPSVPAGTQYVLLFGAEYADVFGKPVPSDFHAQLPDADRRMLDRRLGPRTSILTEAGRVDGAKVREYRDAPGLGPCIQLGAYNCAWQHEEEMLRWYVQVRMAAMADTPGGGIRVRKLSSVMGWAKHSILYEFESVQARHDYFRLHHDRPDMKPWLEWVAGNLVHAPGSSTLGQRIWPPLAS